MNRIVALAVICILVNSAGWPASSDRSFPAREFDLLNYDLTMTISFEHSGYDIFRNKLSATARFSVKNTANSSITEIPILLHRLMKVTRVRDGSGGNLRYSQVIRSLERNDPYQINYIPVSLSRPLPAGEIMQLEIDYQGHLTGYTETGMLYVKEQLDPAFTMIRTETFSYPHVLFPVDDQRRVCWSDAFQQTIHVTVPQEYIAVNAASSRSDNAGSGFVTYHFKSDLPRSTVIIPIAKYQVVRSGYNRIYFFPEDREGAEKVSRSMDKAFHLLAGWFGPLKSSQGISVVEIPVDFGSQAEFPLILQTADAFKNPTDLDQLYHELSHLWNPKEMEIVSPRWNEGLAMFLQGLISEQLGEVGASRKLNEGLFASFQRRLREKPAYQTVPMAEYGTQDLTSLSYSGGSLFFAIVHKIMGQKAFFEMYRSFYETYSDTGATTEQFLNHLRASQNPRVDALVRDWFQTANYAPLVLSASKFEDLLNHY